MNIVSSQNLALLLFAKLKLIVKEQRTAEKNFPEGFPISASAYYKLGRGELLSEKNMKKIEPYLNIEIAYAITEKPTPC